MSEEVAKTESVSENNGSDALDTLKAELEKLKAENGKLKAAQSNASAESAKYKRDLQARMSEQEKAETATKELIEQLKADNEAMKRSQTVAERTASYIGLGFDAALAKPIFFATRVGILSCGKANSSLTTSMIAFSIST